jgi:hypothetical protein
VQKCLQPAGVVAQRDRDGHGKHDAEDEISEGDNHIDTDTGIGRIPALCQRLSPRSSRGGRLCASDEGICKQHRGFLLETHTISDSSFLFPCR